MRIFIHRKTQFNRLLSNLRKAGGRAALAAERVAQIMESLASRNRLSPSKVQKHTRYGEARIEGCRKFDLGGGYRLVYLKKGANLYFTYIGTHDDCDLWIKNNRGLEPETDTGASWVNAQDKNQEAGCIEVQTTKPAPDYDDLLMEKIDERILRRVFQGLCGKDGYGL
jgi:mRNA-degrading endonuclease YafQ of YafQ-DinJ toxin-antitoxin module